MRLYHYTSVSLADGILVSDLAHGHLNTLNGIIGPVVWLTTDPKAEGHGLTHGAETLNDRQMAHQAKLRGEMPKNRSTSDKMRVRLTFDVPEDDMVQLLRFTDYCEGMSDGRGKLFAKWTGLSCYTDMATVDDRRLKAMMKSQPTKEKTWWISFFPVSARFITAVDIRDAKMAYRPYDFEALARHPMEKLGFFAPSFTALQELGAIVKPLHPLGYTKALAFCPAPDATPTVTIRDGGTELSYEIETGKSLTLTADYEPQLSAWVAKYREELSSAWAHAKESYYLFHPEHRKINF
ncbi:hypothetical protein [Burkholderia sp. LMU1-1-1.1]|uniref:hypothetical protein n=1 Tax=Burkholderia sp. LMU1-1-1.1 TaxID=3135266 RepID=UPI003436BB8A